jgi:hypothetical protein
LQPAPVPGSIEPRQQVSGRIAPSGSWFGLSLLVTQERHKLAALDTVKAPPPDDRFPCAIAMLLRVLTGCRSAAGYYNRHARAAVA